MSLPEHDLSIDSDRLHRRFENFNEIGATERGGVNRPALSDANKRARDTLVEWFRDAGLEVRIDEFGNLFGRREGTADLSPVLVGSHVDSQYNGGRYDGVLGVLGALEIVETMNDAGVETPRPVEVVSWTNEEGVRFQPDMLGSGVYAGHFDLDYAYDRTDKSGDRLEDELERIGYRGTEPCEAGDIHAYLELHVEQGPYLAKNDISVGVVEGVYGFTWLNVSFRGQADHAGPTPMHLRSDALVATADVIRAVRRLTGTTGTDLVGTVGSVDADPNSINVIAEEVDFTIDFRSYDNETVDAAVTAIEHEIRSAAEREGVDWDLEEIMRVEAMPFHEDCVTTVAEAAESLGAEHTSIVSGAGHDANYLNEICPTGMVFVPSEGGISHTEDEFTEWEDVTTGVDVLLRATVAQATESQ